MKKERVDKTVLMNALWNTFPSVASFSDFKETDHDVSQRSIPIIIKYAFKNELIEKQTEKSFIDFLAKNNKLEPDKPLPEDLTFSDVLEVVSGNLSVNSVIRQLEIITKNFSLPPIKATMITRLKKHFLLNTSKKRSLLRIIAFRLGEKQPDLNWHYEMLRKITVGYIEKHDPLKEKAGVTIALQLRGKGEIIVPTDVGWLKTELYKCIGYLTLAGSVNKKAILSSGAASFNLKLPKKDGPLEQPRLYDRAIRDILAIAHQMSVRWLISGYGSPQKQLIIIIHAGKVSESNLTIQPLLETKLNSDTNIYLTDFAYLCARVAEVRVGFERYNQRPDTGDSCLNKIWMVKYFWSYSYYDYIPDLLETRMLPVSKSDPSYSEFQRELYFPEQYTGKYFEAFKAMYRFPQSSLLLIEIANVLRARQMPYEANEILSQLLLSNPSNVAARLLRMIIYSNIAQAQTDFFISEMAFERAVAEGEFIIGSNHIDYAILFEFGALYFNRAKKYIQYLRSGYSYFPKENVFNALRTAKEYLLKALATSPTGKDTSSLFWLLYVQCFIELFSKDKKLLDNTNHEPLLDFNNVFKKHGIRMFAELGWLSDEILPDGGITEATFNSLLTIIASINARHDNSMLSRSYIPYAKYAFGSLLWDFAPHLTLVIYNTVLILLNDAYKETEKLIKDNLSVYQTTVNYIAPDEFLMRLQDTIDLIKKITNSNDLKSGDNFLSDPEKIKEISQTKLILLELNWH
ncbi:MAG: hypothetical protein CVU54_18515 [Deltaproteobacteria bacterium HGW-Deltaproteobacteria-12]|jgi:hypothetical protein|nr:MAG: hypothetical protein CVU54_18515 [Deltaproteobacteria bacterium HGW-Deltaproteobacteria-12]